MLANALTILSLTAVFAAAFRIPADIADGVYSVSPDANGGHSWKAIGKPVDLPEASPNPPSRILRTLTKRGQTWCGCKVGMDHDKTDAANSAIQSTVGNGKSVASHGSIVSVKGSSTVFFCNYDGSDTTATKNEAIGGASTITGNCGWYIAGTVQLDGHPHLDFGYLETVSDFCNAAEGSPVHHC